MMKDADRKKRALTVIGISAFIGATLFAVAIPSMIPNIPLTFLVFCYLGTLAFIALALYAGNRTF